MLHLIDNPLIREGFFPPAEQRYAVEPAAERDGVAIAAIARRHEPPASADLLAAWLDAAPETFRVARDRDGQAVGVIALCEPSAVPLRVLDGDPVAAARRADLRRQPVRGGNVTITERAHQRRARRMIEPGDEQRSSLERLLRAAGPASL